MKWLERREYFAEELRMRLIAAGWPESEVGSALSELQDKRLLSETRALEANLASRAGKRAIGRARLSSELERKGADVEAVASVLPDDDQERAKAQELLGVKYPGGVDMPRAARFLASRGFEEEIIRSVLEGLGEE